jgi:hypothetical protein
MTHESLITKLVRAVDEYRRERSAVTEPAEGARRWLPTPQFVLVTLLLVGLFITVGRVAAVPTRAAPAKQSAVQSISPPFSSYPYVVHMRHFALNVGSFCWGYIPIATHPTEPWCATPEALNGFLAGTKFLAPSGTGSVQSANNLPSASGGPRWGYAYSFFLNNPTSERSVTLPVASCNDVALIVSEGAVEPDRISETATVAYHRFPGGPSESSLLGCPCNDELNPTITIPSGAFRLTAITRGAACTSYLRIGETDLSPWVTDLGLEIDWNGLYAYLGVE